MEYPKIAFKGDGTLEGGAKIINELVSLGASDPDDLKGYGSGYYFIEYYGIIDTEMCLPIGYKLVTLEQKQKLFKLI